ncbi:Uncharacterised protein [Mycobacteroides abscessus subsp. abscessus]|nr:Uncharacterised protein [Mycobacteroides abscessus subsp. abscessus]
MPSRFQCIEALMATGDFTASKTREQLLDLLGSFPGDDAFRSIDTAEDVDELRYEPLIATAAT